MGCRSCTSIPNIDTFAYNDFGELTAAKVNGVASTYTYRPDGLRGTKSVNGTLTRHIWDGDEVSAELNADSSVKRTFTHGYAPATCYEGNDHYAFIRDRHGDVIKTVECFTESVIEEYDYDAYGNQESISSTDTNPFRYSGEYYDYETGFIYLRARYYDSTIGSFISEDPARDGANWYAYCAGNPVMYVDPWGEEIVLVGTKDDCETLLHDIQMLTNDKLAIELISESYTNSYRVYKVDGRANSDKALLKGTTLVGDMMVSEHIVEISYDNMEGGEGGASRKDTTKGFSYGNGTDSIIKVGRGEKRTETVIFENGGVGEYMTPSYITLGHELIHSWRMAKGFFIPDTQKGKYSFINKDGDVEVFNHPQEQEELATTGISYWTEPDAKGKIYYYPNEGNYITENALRDEHRLPRRIIYF